MTCTRRESGAGISGLVPPLVVQQRQPFRGTRPES